MNPSKTDREAEIASKEQVNHNPMCVYIEQ